MAPRPYDRRRRSAAVDDTRRRITEATVALHAEKGVGATTYADIARRADVAIPTVYNHFPERSHLIAACGAHLAESLPHPGPEIFAGCRGASSRLARLVGSLSSFYAARGPWLRRQLGESAALPEMADSLERRQAALRELVREALAPAFRGAPPEGLLAPAVALLDYAAWTSLAQGAKLPPRRAEQVLRDTLTTLVRHHRSRPSSSSTGGKS